MRRKGLLHTQTINKSYTSTYLFGVLSELFPRYSQELLYYLLLVMNAVLEEKVAPAIKVPLVLLGYFIYSYKNITVKLNV